VPTETRLLSDIILSLKKELVSIKRLKPEKSESPFPLLQVSMYIPVSLSYLSGKERSKESTSEGEVGKAR
jgi:hypothetical protein